MLKLTLGIALAITIPFGVSTLISSQDTKELDRSKHREEALEVRRRVDRLFEETRRFATIELASRSDTMPSTPRFSSRQIPNGRRIVNKVWRKFRFLGARRKQFETLRMSEADWRAVEKILHDTEAQVRDITRDKKAVKQMMDQKSAVAPGKTRKERWRWIRRHGYTVVLTGSKSDPQYIPWNESTKHYYRTCSIAKECSLYALTEIAAIVLSNGGTIN